MVRNMALEEEVVRQFESFGMPTTGVEAASGSSDVGNVSYRCPAMQPLLAITDEDYALHMYSEMPLLCCLGVNNGKGGMYPGFDGS